MFSLRKRPAEILAVDGVEGFILRISTAITGEIWPAEDFIKKQEEETGQSMGKFFFCF